MAKNQNIKENKQTNKQKGTLRKKRQREEVPPKAASNILREKREDIVPMVRDKEDYSQVALVVKNLPEGDIKGASSIPGSGKSPRGWHGNSLQYFCLENPMDRRARWATVHRVAKSQTRLKRLSTH